MSDDDAYGYPAEARDESWASANQCLLNQEARWNQDRFREYEPVNQVAMRLSDEKAVSDAFSQKFREEDLEWRIGRSGERNGQPWAILFCYVTARAIQSRLDEVVGPARWCLDHLPHERGVVARLGVKICGEWIFKSDGAQYTDIEAFKGGCSDAIKRAAVQWGIGRYLYDLGTTFAEISATKPENPKGWSCVTPKQGKQFWWRPPALAGEFLPKRKLGKADKEFMDQIKDRAVEIQCQQPSEQVEAFRDLYAEVKRNYDITASTFRDAERYLAEQGKHAAQLAEKDPLNVG